MSVRSHLKLKIAAMKRELTTEIETSPRELVTVTGFELTSTLTLVALGITTAGVVVVP